MTRRLLFSGDRAALGALLSCLCLSAAVQAAPCIVSDVGGTAVLPPAGCDYTSPNDDMRITAGLPAGATIEIDGVLENFINIVEAPGGSLGGQTHVYDAQLLFPMVGTGALAGFNRVIPIPLDQVDANIMHSAPRTPGDPVQSFDMDLFRLFGQIQGDPDFDLLRITAGTDFGMPSPGHTTLTRLGPPGSNWNVDSFFDIEYRIDFVGAPGGPLGGMSGSTTGTIRMVTGMPIVPEPSSLALAGLCGLGLVAITWRRK